MIEVTQKLVEKKQNQNQEETQLQQDHQSLNKKEAFPSINKDRQSPPPKMPTEHMKENLLKQVVDESKDQKGVNILEIEEKWFEKLWSMEEQAKQGSNTFGSTPMEEIYAYPNQCEFDTDSICGYIGSIELQEILDEDLKKMPQYLVEHEAKSKIKVLPSI